MHFSLYELFEDAPSINVVDVGASPIDGEPPYQRLVDRGKALVIGFEPNPEQYESLRHRQSPYLKFLPYAIGDGHEAVLSICFAPGMTSLLEPDMEILNHFHGFGEWGKVVQRHRVLTRKLDEVKEVEAIDYLKLDVQGSELAVIDGASQHLKNTLVIHTEVQFIPFYTNQPLFAELDQALRNAGFYLHRFTPLVSRVFKPLMINGDIFAGLSQVLWSEAVYVKAFTRFAELSGEQLLKIAAICHDLYESCDLCALALGHIDRKDGTQRQSRYIGRLTGQG